MGYYVYSNYENCGAYECWLTKPNFTPRKVEHKNSFADQLAAEGQSKLVDVGGIPAEQKEALRRKLNYGRGGMSLQEWDDFLADLEEMDVITHDERFYANGTFLEIPEAAQNGGTYASNGDPEAELDREPAEMAGKPGFYPVEVQSVRKHGVQDSSRSQQPAERVPACGGRHQGHSAGQPVSARLYLVGTGAGHLPGPR